MTPVSAVKLTVSVPEPAVQPKVAPPTAMSRLAEASAMRNVHLADVKTAGAPA